MKKILYVLNNHSFAAIFSKVISAFLTFLFLFLVAKATSTGDAGVFLYSYSVMMVLVQLSRAGTDNSIVKELSNSKDYNEHKQLLKSTSFFVFLVCH